MPWTVVAADRAGTELGEVRQATERSITPRPIRRVPTCSLRVRSDNWLVPYFMLGEKTLLKWYDDDGVLRFNGPLNPSTERVVDAGGGSMAVAAAGGAIRMQGRLIGRDRTGKSYGTALAPLDRSEIHRLILADANAIAATGIIEGSIGQVGSKSFVGPWHMKPALEAWTENAAPLDGPDWEVEPIEPLSNAGAIGRLNTAAAFGQDRPDAYWEFGTGKHNVASWRHVLSLDTVANAVYNLPPGWPDNAAQGIIGATDAASIADRGRQEAIVQADLAVDDFRTKLVAEHLRIRKTPRQVISFDPVRELGQSLRYGIDYREGDLIRFAALERFPVYDSSGTVVMRYDEQLTVDIVARLFAVTFTFDGEGVATPSFTIVEEG